MSMGYKHVDNKTTVCWLVENKIERDPMNKRTNEAERKNMGNEEKKSQHK